MKIKKQLKKIKAAQREYQVMLAKEQSKCAHVKKNGETRLEKFVENGVEKGRCKKCGAVVLIDQELLTTENITMSTDVVKSALAELKSQNAVGKINIDDSTLKIIHEFESNVLNDLPEFMSTAANAPEVEHKKNKKGKKHGKKKGKNKKKDFKKRRWDC